MKNIESKTYKKEDILNVALQVIHDEVDSITKMRDRIGDSFVEACETILNCKGRVIVSGMGKSGHISRKMAATLASTGTPAFFVHPSEALHGDIGMIKEEDVVIAISYSGSTEELITLAAAVKQMDTPLIAMTGDANSQLSKLSEHHLNIGVEKEACPLGLAPTSSTTVTLVMGDALAVALLETRGFTSKDFARSHPAGRLGKRLLIKVKDLMLTEKEIPCVSANHTVNESIYEITSKHLGATLVSDQHNHLLGIFTDGDLRRAIENNTDIKQNTIETLYTKDCIACDANDLAIDTLNIMQEKSISVLPVIDKNKYIVGILHLHELLKAGIL